MPTITFVGRVFPAYYQISLSSKPLDWKWGEENLILHFDCRVEKSIVTVACTLDRYRPEYFGEIHKRAFDIIRSAINLAAFASGVGYSVIFESVIDTSGQKTMFVQQDLSLAHLCTSFSLHSQPGKTPIGRIWDLVVSDPPLFQALDDLIVSITLPHHAPVGCARAIEGLRNLIATSGAPVSQAWEQMRYALRLDRSFLQLITDTSAGPRHGDRSYIPGATITEIFRRSWIIMDRYLEYRKRGNIPLPATDFPVLAG
jgi:hypothetical protein